MKRIGVVLVLLAIAAPVLAGGIDVAINAPHRIAGSTGADRATVVYSNTATSTGYGSTTSGNEVGDDMALTGVGTLDTLAFSVWNSDFTALHNLITANLEVKFYNYSIDPNGLFVVGSLIGGFTDPAQTLNLLPGYGTALSFTNLSTSLSPPIVFGQNKIIASLKITNLTGGALTAGQFLYTPPSVGSSYPYFFKNGTYGWWFGSTGPAGNWYWQVGVIPEPAGMLLLGLAGLLIRRR